MNERLYQHACPRNYVSVLLTWHQLYIDKKMYYVYMYNIVCIVYNYYIRCLHVNSKDVRLPVQLQRAMATEAEADREAKAKVRVTYLNT